MLEFLMIGYGTMGATHASKIKASGKLKSLVVLDINPERLQAAVQDGYMAFANLDSAYEWLQQQGQQEFDVLVVTSNTATHYQYLEQAIQRSATNNSTLPAVFVEKPIVATAEEATQLQQVLETDAVIDNLTFMCAYLLRESPAVDHLIEKIQTNHDTIKEVKIVWQKQREPKRPSAGVVQDEATHSLDLVQYIMRELGMDTTADALEILSAIRTTSIVDQAAQNALYPEGDKNRNPIAEINYKLQLGKVKVEGLSSFLIGPQQRCIEFIGEHATYKLEFDKNKADWCDGQPFANDKIASLWDSFLNTIETGNIPKQTASFMQAIDDVKLTDLLEAEADLYLQHKQNPEVLFAFSASNKPIEDVKTAHDGFRPTPI
jgi:predicted dehydrogenase